MLTASPQLAKKYHPDTNKEKGSKERFVEIQAAYDVSTAAQDCLSCADMCCTGAVRLQEEGRLRPVRHDRRLAGL
jgi:hypothetical protein